MNNPLYRGTMVSEDGKAMALYLPIREKHFSYNVARLVEELSKEWNPNDRVYITGLPVAEDTFGVEMLVQMATSAPLAPISPVQRVINIMQNMFKAKGCQGGRPFFCLSMNFQLRQAKSK